LKKGVPERGDILSIGLDPVKSREQQGKRPVLVLTPLAFNQLGLVLVCPVTTGGGFTRRHGFAVPLGGAGARAQGVALCHQVRTLDYRERRAEWVETLPAEVVEDALARVRTLLD
jgi:mRNA interferase ChpB